jgi:hypothetical protein
LIPFFVPEGEISKWRTFSNPLLHSLDIEEREDPLKEGKNKKNKKKNEEWF